MIELFSAIAVREAINTLLPEFERATGHTVLVKFAVNPEVARLVLSGASFDVVLVNPHFIDDLVTSNRVRGDARPLFGRIAMGVGIKAGRPKIDVSTVDAFKRSLLAAESVGYTREGSSGRYFIGLLDRLGIANEMQAKLKSFGGGLVGTSVANGEVELGIVPVANILSAAPGAELAGAFPAELQSFIDFGLAINRSTRDERASAALVAFLCSVTLDQRLKRMGIDRVS